MRFVAGAALLAGLAPYQVHCADSPSPAQVWVGKGQAGFVASHGNSAGIVSAERWDALWQPNYQYSRGAYTFGALRYQRDLFSGFRYQASASAGLGYKFVDSKATQLNAQVGAGYRVLRPEVLTKDASGAVISRTPQDTRRNAIATAGLAADAAPWCRLPPALPPSRRASRLRATAR